MRYARRRGQNHNQSKAAQSERALTLGLGRTVALCYRSSTSHQIREHIRYLYSYLKRQCDRTLCPRTRGVHDLPAQAEQLAAEPRARRLGPAVRLGFGRIGASEIEAPNMFANLV